MREQMMQYYALSYKETKRVQRWLISAPSIVVYVLRLSDKVDNLLQRFILNFPIPLESLTALHMTAHFAN